MIVGIDPGAKGAIVIIGDGGLIEAWSMPTVEVVRNRKKKTELDLAKLGDILFGIPPGVGAIVEQVGAMPGQGVSSMFAFGKAYGAVLGALAALQVPVTHVAPGVWKRALGVREGKGAALLRASELMPAYAHLWTPKRLVLDKEHAIGVADAALIAYYGAKQNG